MIRVPKSVDEFIYVIYSREKFHINIYFSFDESELSTEESELSTYLSPISVVSKFFFVSPSLTDELSF